jgi:hypothetical protein
MGAQRLAARPVLKVLSGEAAPAMPAPLQRCELERTAHDWPGRSVIYRWAPGLPPEGCGFCAGRCTAARGADGQAICMVYVEPDRLAEAPCPAGLAPLSLPAS